MKCYRLLRDHVLFRQDPEVIHERIMRLMSIVNRALLRYPLGTKLRGANKRHEVLGLEFPGRFGLAAGFDKNALAPLTLELMGFAWVEIGTVTARPQVGNDRPRMWRISDQRALRNAMGFNNDGADVVARRLAELKVANPKQIIGVNIGKTLVTPLEEAPQDYAYSARKLGPYASYLVINVSSPNTQGLRSLQAVQALGEIVDAVHEALQQIRRPNLPVLIKLAPDLEPAELQDLMTFINESSLAGVIATNTTIKHSLGAGGVSGPMLLPRSVQMVSELREGLAVDKAIIGVGGVQSAGDARKLLRAGADLVQGYTGFIYGGPLWASQINYALDTQPVK